MLAMVNLLTKTHMAEIAIKIRLMRDDVKVMNLAFKVTGLIINKGQR
jgi:hypothetical protein